MKRQKAMFSVTVTADVTQIEKSCMQYLNQSIKRELFTGSWTFMDNYAISVS